MPLPLCPLSPCNSFFAVGQIHQTTHKNTRISEEERFSYSFILKYKLELIVINYVFVQRCKIDIIVISEALRIFIDLI